MDAKVKDLVLCDRLGKEEFEIVEIRDREYRVKSTVTHKVESIFKVHCHIPSKMRIANMERRRSRVLAAAESIGRPKNKPGKR